MYKTSDAFGCVSQRPDDVDSSIADREIISALDRRVFKPHACDVTETVCCAGSPGGFTRGREMICMDVAVHHALRRYSRHGWRIDVPRDYTPPTWCSTLAARVAVNTQNEQDCSWHRKRKEDIGRSRSCVPIMNGNIARHSM